MSDGEIETDWLLLKHRIENKKEETIFFLFWMSGIVAVLIIGFVGISVFRQDGIVEKEMILSYLDKIKMNQIRFNWC
ncbi:MAG: hypothetical protein EP145_05320 [Bacteroides uniformis]|nr:hypothetical protein [Bacteroides uniformis]